MSQQSMATNWSQRLTRGFAGGTAAVPVMDSSCQLNAAMTSSMKRKGFFTIVVAAVGLLPTLLLVPPTSAEGAGPMASGAAHITRDGEALTLSFNVKQLPSGEVVGQAQRQARPVDATIHYELDCLRIVGNKAIVGGIVTRSTSPSFVVGRKAIFSVEDNGEGPNEAADRVSFVLHATSATMPGTCHTVTPPAAATFDVEYGNVQVRP